MTTTTSNSITNCLDYPVNFDKDDNGTVLATFPDFPEAVTFGEDEDDALARARDALATIIEAYIKDRQRLPKPSPGKTRVQVPALITAKAQLSDSMLSGQIKKSELARRLNWHMPQVDRLLDIHHGSRLDQLEAAASALGKRLVVVFEPKDHDLPPMPALRQAKVDLRSGGRLHRLTAQGTLATGAREAAYQRPRGVGVRKK